MVDWRADFRKADLDSDTIYEKHDPAIARNPTFGGWKEGAFDRKQVISLALDVG